mgnify:FL=1|tara:strand:+ start:1419 stop:1916 length:498 start_codon:yes stop_codon:yes gene_type:complete
MARITVEDCIDKFPSRFELVLVASNRARRLHSGETPTIEKDNDKNTVIALREIAEEKLTTNDLKNDLIEEYQVATFDRDEEIDLVEEDQEINDDKEQNTSVTIDQSSSESIMDDADNEKFSSDNDDDNEDIVTKEENTKDKVISEAEDKSLTEDETINQYKSDSI